MKRIDYSKNENFITQIIGVLPMNLGYKVLWTDNILLEDICDLGIYINNNEVLQDYINECFLRNTYEGQCLSKMYVVSTTSKIEQSWGEVKETINSIIPVGRIDMDRRKNKFFYQEMSSTDKDIVNYGINFREL